MSPKKGEENVWGRVRLRRTTSTAQSYVFTVPASESGPLREFEGREFDMHLTDEGVLFTLKEPEPLPAWLNGKGTA